jgi:hypothetical protein
LGEAHVRGRMFSRSFRSLRSNLGREFALL